MVCVILRRRVSCTELTDLQFLFKFASKVNDGVVFIGFLLLSIKYASVSLTPGSLTSEYSSGHIKQTFRPPARSAAALRGWNH